MVPRQESGMGALAESVAAQPAEPGSLEQAAHGAAAVSPDVVKVRFLAPPSDWSLDARSGLLSAPRWKLALKRMIDIWGAAFLLLLVWPIMLGAALAIRLSSRGPVLFRQERVGHHGRPFTMIKFRTMHRNAEEMLADVLFLNEHQAGPVFKVREDPRITPVGRVLRRTSIDELPQLFHVLAGTMSLVGPRPALPNETAEYSETARRRLLAKPGLTCVWQVSGRSEVDFDTWLEMDLDYIRNWSIGMDLRLLFATLPAVLSGEGAY